MKLFEHEGKDLFSHSGIVTPARRLLKSLDEQDLINVPVVAKAQVLSGKRGKRGLVKVFKREEALRNWLSDTLGQEFDGERVSEILLEEPIEIAKELFVSITYSTKTRGPVLLFSESGGVEVESQRIVSEVPLRIGMDLPPLNIELHGLAITEEKQRQRLEAKLWETINRLWKLFQEKDLFLAEINPLVITKSLEVVALDSKVVTDDAAHFRQKWELPERNMLGKDKSWAELEAEKIDETDHRGVVGRVYLDLDGDIGVIAAGGGASLVAMDAIVSYGLKPANYTEFSGNPPEEKVKRLSEIVLHKDNLKGAILVGGKANFTDQVETLTGFLKALEEINPRYPIVIRRDGPRMAEAKQMLEKAATKHGWKLFIYDSQTSIIDAVKKLVEVVSNDE